MNKQTKIAIIGAGPAGTSLAIRLAKENFDVTLIEREKFPRQKLCGEFISPECFAYFKQLGVLEEMLSAGGKRISETVFYSQNGKSVSIPSMWLGGGVTGALSLSRSEMDFRLLKKAKATGVKVLEETSAVGLLLEKNEVFGVKTRGNNNEIKEIAADLTIDAAGRAGVLEKLFERETVKNRGLLLKNRKAGLIGFKAHLENAVLEKNRCEIYSFQNGYGGLSPVEKDLVNFCFLVKAATVKKYIGQTNKIVEEIICRNKRANETLQNAKPVHDWMAVSIEGFGFKNLHPAKNLLAVGDAAAFTDPFTGSGMLMALESAGILAQSIVGNSPNRLEIARCYKISHDKAFRGRLRFCSLVRRMALMPWLAGITITFLSLNSTMREILARATRRNGF